MITEGKIISHRESCPVFCRCIVSFEDVGGKGDHPHLRTADAPQCDGWLLCNPTDNRYVYGRIAELERAAGEGK